MESPARRARRRALPRHPLWPFGPSPSRRRARTWSGEPRRQPNRRLRQNRSRIFRRRRPNLYRRRHLRNRRLSRRRKSPHRNRAGHPGTAGRAGARSAAADSCSRRPTSRLPRPLRSSRRCLRPRNSADPVAGRAVRSRQPVLAEIAPDAGSRFQRLRSRRSHRRRSKSCRRAASAERQRLRPRRDRPQSRAERRARARAADHRRTPKPAARQGHGRQEGRAEGRAAEGARARSESHLVPAAERGPVALVAGTVVATSPASSPSASSTRTRCRIWRTC